MHDYGIDLSLHTYDSNGECENGAIRLQVKATEHLKMLADRRTISFSVDLRDVRHWLQEIMPVIFVVYDAVKEKAYWLYVQPFFATRTRSLINKAQKKVAVSIPRRNVGGEAAVRRFAQFRDNVLEQTKGVITHYD